MRKKLENGSNDQLVFEVWLSEVCVHHVFPVLKRWSVGEAGGGTPAVDHPAPRQVEFQFCAGMLGPRLTGVTQQ